MSSATRRAAIRNGAALAFGAVWALNAQSVFAQGTRQVTLPSRPMRLRRLVSRQLIDGNHLTVARTWEVGFIATGTGWQVTGQQLGVDVKVPPGLEALAGLERSRQVNEAFPLELDSRGRIVHGAPADRQVDLESLASAARDSVQEVGGDASDSRQLAVFLAQMQQASLSSMTKFPQDLFFPDRGELSENKLMDLPGGLTGRMELVYRAETDPQNGLLSSSERSVITRIENQELRSSEHWQLASS